MPNTDNYFNGSKMYFPNSDVTSYIARKEVIKLEGKDSTGLIVRFSLDQFFNYIGWAGDVNPKVIYWANDDALYNLKLQDISAIPNAALTSAGILTYFDKLSGTGGTGGTADNLAIFVPSKVYSAGNIIIDSNKIYRANTNFTAGASFNLTNWTEISASSGTGTLTQNQEKQWGFRGGNNDTGDIIGTEDVLLVPTTITNAVLVIYSGTFPATPTTLKVKSSTVDYITVSVPGNQGAGVIACTIATALINAVPLSPISAILNLSQACPGVDYIIYTTTNS